MAKGNEIVVISNPKGMFLEGIVYGAPKPGTLMEVKAGVAPITGRQTWQAYSGTTGKPALVAVLMQDYLQGKLATDAYVSGSRCFLYCPIAGEELNVLVKDITGTGDDVTIGEQFMIDSGTGKLVINSNGTMVPFIALEAVTDPVADTLCWCMYTGH
jgi:hypothetical protein